MDLPTPPFYLMNDIPHNTTSESLIRFLAAFIHDLPKEGLRFGGAPQDASDADVKDLKANIENLEIRPSRLDDELRISVIKFKNTPQCLLDLSSYSFPLKTELGKIWQGVDMASKDRAGQTALIRAVIKNNLELAEMLAEYENTDINAQDQTGLTALHWACEKSLPELVGLCLSVPGLKINLKSNLNLTAFDIAGQKAYDSGDDTILTLFYDSLFELEKYDPDTALLQFLTLRAKPTSTEKKPDFPEHLQILTVPGDPEDPEEDKIVLPEEALSGPTDSRNWELVEAILDRGISDNAGGDYINKTIEKAEEEEEEERRVGTAEGSVGAAERRADIVERLKARTDVVGEAGGVDRPLETEIRAGGGRAELVDRPFEEEIGAAGGRAETVDRPPEAEVRVGPVRDEVEGGGPRQGAKSFARGGVGALGSFISRGIKNVKGDESEKGAEDDGRLQELKEQIKRWREGDDRSEEALQRAVSEGDSRAVKMLLDAGVSANGGGLRKQTAWKWMGKDRRLERQGEVQRLEGQNLEGQRLEEQYLERQTVLERAAERGHLKIVKLLLDAGADVNARSNRTRERSPEDAMANEVMISPKSVFRGVLPAVEQREQRINSDIIMEIERPDEVRRSGVERPDWMQTPLGLAAKNGHLEVVKLLLRKKADVNGRDDGLWTALHWAVWGSRQEPAAEIQTEVISDSPMVHPEVLTKDSPMVHPGVHTKEGPMVHPDVPGKRSGMLFGHKEMRDSRPGRMHPEIVDLLLERGADVHATDSDWLAALPAEAEAEASTADGGYGEILQKLRRKAAEPAIQDKSPRLPRQEL